jgi:uroporphyrinogen decarboxylase
MNLLDEIRRTGHQVPHQPDFERFKRAITTRIPGPVPVAELFADFEVVSAVLDEPVVDMWEALNGDHPIPPSELDRAAARYVDQVIRFCRMTGWDHAYAACMIPFERLVHYQSGEALAVDSQRKRLWTNDNEGPIGTWEDFERYPWPRDIERINLAARKMARSVPDGMQVMVMPGGIFEWTTWLMGLVPFSYALVDQPELVDAVIDKVTETIYLAAEDILTEPAVGGLFMGDDWGYATGTMISVKAMREKNYSPVEKDRRPGSPG